MTRYGGHSQPPLFSGLTVDVSVGWEVGRVVGTVVPVTINPVPVGEGSIVSRGVSFGAGVCVGIIVGVVAKPPT